MPLASFIITQPAWLAVACAAVYTTAAGMHAARHGGGRWTIGLRIVLAGIVAALVAAVLVALPGPVSDALLLILATLGGAALAALRYARESTALGRMHRYAAQGLRTAAWLVVLVLVGHPAVDRVLVRFDKPLLPVLLDQSQSMALSDRSAAGAGGTRAAQVAAALQSSSEVRARLAELYDLRLLGFGARLEVRDDWQVQPEAPLTRLAAALVEAGELRGTGGQGAAAVLLVSDGAENVSPAGAVRAAAEGLAQRRVPLLAVGVGPEPGTTPEVQLEPLVVPPRVGTRDRLHLAATGRVRGCAGHTLTLAALWNDTVAESRLLPVRGPDEPLAADFELQPPMPGVHRLTVRALLPPELGGVHAEVSELVEVGTDRARILYVEQAPRAEAAFVLRALRADPRFEVTPVFLLDDSDAGSAWREADVVILGRLLSPLPESRIDEFAAAVLERGTGLLVSDGETVLRAQLARKALGAALPLEVAREPARPARRFLPQAAGLRHPVLERVAAAAAGETGLDAPADENEAWGALPPLRNPVRLVDLKPMATVLATDGANRPLLVAQEAGRGRCLVAAWESTWPWALHSDFGRAVHRLLWRNMAAWLANRRPRAWVLAEQGTYALAALAERPVRVRAGVAGAHPQAPPPATRLSLMKLDESGRPGPGRPVALRRAGEEWVADLPQPGLPELTGGAYLLEFTATETEAGAGAAGTTDALVAYGRFEVQAESLEQRGPTSNLGLLREAAERTAACGGRYAPLAELADVLAGLAREDRRTRVETSVRWSVVERNPGWLLTTLLGLLTLEWIVRKWAGLA